MIVEKDPESSKSVFVVGSFFCLTHVSHKAAYLFVHDMPSTVKSGGLAILAFSLKKTGFE